MRPEPLGSLRRSHTCNQLRDQHVGQKVTLMGWVHRRRDLGGLIFLDLRDRYGITQCVLNPEVKEAFAKAEKVRSEFVLAVVGTVGRRPDNTQNKNLDTGAVELVVEQMLILNTSKTLPMPVAEDQQVDESLRLQYRYLDLRRPAMSKAVLLRHNLAKAVRDYMDGQSFMEIETPMLMSSTPEGARDYLVPSRVNKGKFYALPQSPQIFKQLLMVSGQDRYFQIARCFRDEDLRADRQPEFTQIDIEMSFVGQEDIFAMVEGLVGHMWRTVMNVELPAQFRRMPYSEAAERYGSDKPDLRFGLDFFELQVGDIEFGAFQNTTVKAFRVPGKGGLSRKETDAWVEMAKSSGLGGLMFASLSEGAVKSSILKFVGEERFKAIFEQLGVQEGDLVVIGAHAVRKTLNSALGKIRLEMGKKFELIDKGKFEFAWVVDFPLFAWNEETQKLEPEHHPFTSCHPDDLDLLEKDPAKARAAAYDLVLNGNELASGSIRIHQRDMQILVLSKTDLTIEEIQAKFGFLLDAFEFGAPPHGGIALGLDRLVAICAGFESIREVIAFPKNQQAMCLMTGAPVDATKEQLDTLALEIQKSKVGA
ncbi:aspartate--tRNA ligase [bacterium]|nr:aspartate--tRNA ligase [bacterium]